MCYPDNLERITCSLASHPGSPVIIYLEARIPFAYP